MENDFKRRYLQAACTLGDKLIVHGGVISSLLTFFISIYHFILIYINNLDWPLERNSS